MLSVNAFVLKKICIWSLVDVLCSLGEPDNIVAHVQLLTVWGLQFHVSFATLLCNVPLSGS
jgi:hypothetical protein